MNFLHNENIVMICKLFLIFFCCDLIFCQQQQPTFETNKHDVAVRDSILLITTLDGSLHAVSQRSGLIKWTVDHMPILQMSPVANISGESKQHFLLPDPKDGSLYLFNGFSDKKHKTLEKLPFTISELVSTSPCRSSDGMIYTSKKTDEWMILDIQNGNNVDIINVDSPVCHTKTEIPDSLVPQNNLLYLFKSEYQISIFNGDSREKIMNFTYIDYSPSMISSISQSSYEYLHLTSSANGKIATIDVTNGQNSFLWSQQFSSPIVSIYKLTENSNFPIIHRVPFFTIGSFINASNFFDHKPLFPSVYIGELTSSKSLYALSALVENNQIRKDSDYLIEGPEINSINTINILELLGYYEYPKESEIKFSVIPKTQLIASYLRDPTQAVPNNNEIKALPVIEDNSLSNSIENYTFWLHYLIILLIFLIIISIFVTLTTIYFLNEKSKNWNNKGSSSSSSSPHSRIVNIGKITFDPADIIGRGCAGTCVYKGLFENKQKVAVKRIVSDCFKLANREIDLLRKLQHPNLIRYFATENDEQFSYIAIELAEMTLSNYIEKKEQISFTMDTTEMLYQACLGLAHLHSLDIVHRDIKPQNILISLPLSPNNKRKIMITDFGVSKILTSDSLTTDASAGTEGWIAPEILRSKLAENGNNNEKASKPNDIFSLGCLIYYTHTGGDHPFGNQMNRQTSILNGDYNLDTIKNEEDICLCSLVEPMISNDLKERPSIEVVIKHPFFWDEKKCLQFMQDVSDRFECEANDSEISKILEQGSLDVCRGDWRRYITIELQEDLRKFRSYKGSSVKNLLRAIRNKRHHYHELDQKVQNSLGSIPHEFVRYFTTRFPRLIIHSYIAMQHCSSEDLFQHYYHQQPQQTSSAINDNNNNQSNGFRFKSLPRSTVRWNERWKEEPFVENFIFNNIRQRTTPTNTTKKNYHNNDWDNNSNKMNSTNGFQPNINKSSVDSDPITDSIFYNDVFKT